MLTSKKVAITGDVASGKSTVCSYFQQLGCSVVSADNIVHQLLSDDQSIINQVRGLLGSQAYSDGRLDRKKIADIVFSQPELLTSLERLLHPPVVEVIEKRYQNFLNEKGASLFVAEVPLLYEIHYEPAFEAVIYVDTPAEQCLQQFLNKGGSSIEFERRRARLLAPAEKKQRAAYVLENYGSLEDLYSHTRALFTVLMQHNP